MTSPQEVLREFLWKLLDSQSKMPTVLNGQLSLNSGVENDFGGGSGFKWEL